MSFLPPAQWLETAIRIDSITDRSNEELVRFLSPLLSEAGLSVTEHRVREKGKTFINLIACSKGPRERGLLALNTHLDTVPFSNAKEWTSTGGDPFKLTRVEDRLYGLGAADVKLDFLCKIWAAKHARRVRPFVLVGTYGEERGLVGAKQLLEKKKIKPAFALVGEPSKLELIYAHKGHFCGVVRVPLGRAKGTRRTWKGVAAHSSTPHLGDNAIAKAVGDVVREGRGIAWLEGGTAFNIIPDGCQADVTPEPTDGTKRLAATLDLLQRMNAALAKKNDKRFDPSFATLSVTLARMRGTAVELTFDIRLLPDSDIKKIERELVAGLKKAGATLVDRTLDPALTGRATSRFIKAASRALESCHVAPVVTTKATSTEAAVYSTHGAEAAVFGPGISIGNVHRPNEHNLLSHLEAATRFYRAMLELPDKAF